MTKQKPMNITLTTSVDGLRDLVRWLEKVEASQTLTKGKAEESLTGRIKFYKEVLENKYEFC